MSSSVRTLNWRAWTIPTGLMATLILALAGCTAPMTSPPAHRVIAQTSTATPQAQLTPVTGILGPVPTTCPSISSHMLTMTTSAHFGSFVDPTVLEGISPVWEQGIGLLPGKNTLSLFPLGPTPTPTPSAKAIWVVGPNVMQPVTLQGRDLLSGAPIWFDIYNTHSGTAYNATLRATLDPAHPSMGFFENSAGRWNFWGIGLIFTRAGCYDLEATWLGGGWHVVMAVGR